MSDIDPADLVVVNLPASRTSLRVAVVTETYPPEVNGVALTLARLVEGLREAHHDVQLIRPRQTGADGVSRMHSGFEEVLMRGVPIPRYPDLRMGLPAKSALVRQWQLRRPDVVHIATEGPLGWSALRAAMYLKLPVSSDFRTNFHAYSRHYGVGFLYRPIMAYLRKFHNRTACTMVPTRALAVELSRAGFQRLHVVPRGVDTEGFDPAYRSARLRAQWGVAENDPVVLGVGRLAAEKNWPLLLQAFSAIERQRPSARLVVVGAGPLQAALQQSCPRALFAGQLKGRMLAEHYASADLFLLPSQTETFGNVTVEAMASALPVVAFDHAAAAEFIQDGVNGRVAPLGEPDRFMAAACELAGQPQVGRRLGQAARQTAMGLRWPHIVSQFEAVLMDVVSQTR